MARYYATTNSSAWGMFYDVTEGSYSIENNTSPVGVNVYLYRPTSASYYGGTANISMTLNGETKSSTAYPTYPTNIGVGEANAHLMASFSYTVPHDNDGSKTISFSLSWSANFNPTSASGSDTMVLTTIPRYFTQTPKLELVSKTTTTVTLKWTTSENASRSQYRIGDSGSWVDVETGINKKTGTMTISNLTVNTSYRIYGDFMRADSSLWAQTKPYIDVKTYDCARISSAPDFNDEGNPTITYTNPLGNAATTLQARIENSNGTSSYVNYRNINKTGTLSYTFNFTTAERNTLRSACSDSNSLVVKFVIRTEVDGTTYWSVVNKTMSIVNGNPTFSDFTYQDTGSLPPIVGSNQIIVRTQSYLQITISSANKMIANKGATPTYYSVTIGDKTVRADYSSSDLNITFGTTTSVGNQRIIVRAYDSRGNSKEVYKDVYIYDYQNTTINATGKRLNNFENQTTISINGQYSPVTINNVDKNGITWIRYQYREVGGSWIGDPVYLTYTENNGTYTCDDVILSLDNTKAFEFEILLLDEFFNSTSVLLYVDIGQPIFFISSNLNACFVNGYLDVNGDIKQNGVSIIESGSNTNGNYIKFSDGKLICYAKKDVIFLFNSNQKWGSMWESDATSLGSFPYAFYETPVVNVTNNSGSGGFIEGLLETTTTNIGKMYICRPLDTNSSIAYTLSIIAIGRWK